MPDQEDKKLPTSGMFYESPYGVGEYASFDYSAEPFADLLPDEKNALLDLVRKFSQSDSAARRNEVEDAWESNWFEYGYQHMEPRRGGGWQLPGESSKWGVSATANLQSFYSTNTYGRDHDIIVSALSREIPYVQFFAANPNDELSLTTAEIADDFKDIFSMNNELRSRLVEAASLFFKEDRVVFHVFYELNGQRYGEVDAEEVVEEDEELQEEPVMEATPEEEGDETPKSPEEVANMPADEDESEEAEESAPKKKPQGREKVQVYGKLGSKVPITVNEMCDMPAMQLYDDIDVSIAKARYPWIADKIKPGTCGIGEIELDYIARINTKLALQSVNTTGDSGVRLVVEQKTWMRPAFFFDPCVNADVRDRLLKKFRSGCLVVVIGTEFALARAECMDNRLRIAHPFPGAGQNRRALGSSLKGPQKRLNNWVDLLDTFFRSTISKKWMDNDAFNVEKLRDEPNMPGDIGSFQRQPGVPVNELIFVEPQPTHQPSLPDFVMKFFLDVPQSLSGAVPSLFGGAISGQVGSEGYLLQRNQALERLSVPWNSLKAAFAEVFRQAVICAGECRDEEVSEFVPGRGLLRINADDLKGNVLCYPQYDSTLPEAESEREEKYAQIVELSTTNKFYAQVLTSTKNLREIANATKMSKLDVPGEQDSECQLAEFEALLTSSPQKNPNITQLTGQLQQIKEGIAEDVAKKVPIAPEQMQMALKFEQMVTQQVQQIMQTQPFVSSVPVAQDDSENHVIHAQTCYEWMNGFEGRKFKKGTDEQKAAFANIALHRKEHQAVAAQLAAQAPAPLKESVSITVPLDKMAPAVQAELLNKAGLSVKQSDIELGKTQETNHKIAQEAVPETIKETAIENRENHEPVV